MQSKKTNSLSLPIYDDSSKQFRAFAAESMELARRSRSIEERAIYLKMASLWHTTAVRWENDLLRRQIISCKGSA